MDSIQKQIEAFPKTMNIYALPGHKVKATKETINYGANQDNKTGVEIEKVYTVKKTIVHSCSTDVYLEELEGRFNSVIFVDLVEQPQEMDKQHPCYNLYH